MPNKAREKQIKNIINEIFVSGMMFMAERISNEDAKKDKKLYLEKLLKLCK